MPKYKFRRQKPVITKEHQKVLDSYKLEKKVVRCTAPDGTVIEQEMPVKRYKRVDEMAHLPIKALYTPVPKQDGPRG